MAQATAHIPRCHWAGRPSSPLGSCTSLGAGWPVPCGWRSVGYSVGIMGTVLVSGPPAESPRWCSPTSSHLQVFQFLHQRPGADETLIEEGENGRTFQDCLPESSPRTCSVRGESRVIPSLHPSLSFCDFQQAVSIRDYGDSQTSV